MGVAEVGVYAAYLRKVEEARGKEMKKKERKRVVGPVGDGVTRPRRAALRRRSMLEGRSLLRSGGKVSMEGRGGGLGRSGRRSKNVIERA